MSRRISIILLAVGIIFIFSGCNQKSAQMYFEHTTQMQGIMSDIAIFSLTPSYVTNDSGFTILIKGAGFDQESKIFVNGRRYLSRWIQFANENTLKVFVPQNAPAGNYNVYIKNPDGGISNKITFKIVPKIQRSEKG